MPINYEYSVTKTYTNELEVSEPGSCAIVGHGTYNCGIVKNFGDYYLIINTVMGVTKTLQFGPIDIATEKPADGFSLITKTFKYKESTINKEVNQFLNNFRFGIDSAEEIEKEVAYLAIPTTPIWESFMNGEE